MLGEGEAVYTTRKPFNPVINEIHLAYVDYAEARNKDVLNASLQQNTQGSIDGWSTFVSEQVSHHPPVMAMVAENKKHGIRLECSAAFEVKFGSNSASVNVIGPMTIKTQKETFVLSQAVPNLVIKNVVWGTKYIMFEGSLFMYCVESGFCANLHLREEDGQINTFSGTLHKSKPGSTEEGPLVSEFHGLVGREGFLKPSDSVNETKFFDKSVLKKASLSYLPRAAQSPFESIQVWREANEAIVANDIVTADTHKKKVEAAQRVRQKQRIDAGLMNEGRFFLQQVESAHGAGAEPEHDLQGDDHKAFKSKTFELTRPLAVPALAWEFRDNVTFDSSGIKALEEFAKKEEEELARQRAEAEKAAAESSQAEGDGSCVVM